MLTLRQYQREAIDAAWNYLRANTGNPVIVLPTGAGKNPVAATMAREAVKNWGGRVLITAHIRELLSQSAEKLSMIAPDVNFGVYSAGLKSRELGYPVTIGGIQSIYNKADQLGKIDLVLGDECHRWGVDGEGMYRTLFAALKERNPHMRVVGLSATPFRTSTGPICGPDNIFSDICYEVGIKELISQGYLSKIVSKGTRSAKVDTSKLHIRAGEFVQEEVDALMLDPHQVALACIEILERTIEARKSVLVFASSVAHGEMIAETMKELDFPGGVATVFGETDSDERTEILHAFKAGRIRYLVNCAVLTEGFDAPNVDCVVLLRPTASPGLYYQMVGRGFRIADGKTDCCILDFGQNILRHGPVDAIDPAGKGKGDGKGEAPAKECPECQSIIAAGFAVCPDCGFKFPPRGSGHDTAPGEESILSEPVTMSVENVEYRKHFNIKKGSTTLKVTYLGEENLESVDEWVCFEHQGFARSKAEMWWGQRNIHPCPRTVDEALAVSHTLKIPNSITFERQGQYPRITKYEGMHEPEQVPF